MKIVWHDTKGIYLLTGALIIAFSISAFIGTGFITGWLIAGMLDSFDIAT